MQYPDPNCAGYVRREIQRGNRTLLIFNGIVLALMTAFFLFAGKAVFTHFWNDPIQGEVGGWVVAASLAPFIIMAARNVCQGTSRWRDFQRNPEIRYLEEFGAAESIVAEIEAEMRAGAERPLDDRATVTDSWITSPNSWGLRIVSLFELAWVYERVTKRCMNGIYAGTTYHIVLREKDGRRAEIKAGADSAKRFLITIGGRAPWAIYGYTPERRLAWRRHRKEFVSDVEARFQEATSTQMP